MSEPLFTVFTATFNRASCINRVYDSLQAQTLKDFEWIVVDDGSTDDTESVVKGFEKVADFPVRYFRKAHEGKPAAWNMGVREARGELFVSADSDDSFLPNALESIRAMWESIPLDSRDGFRGVSCRCYNEEGEIVGSPDFPEPYLDAASPDVVFKYGMAYEMWGMNRTSVLRKYPMPVIDGLRFYPAIIIWDKISKKYKSRFFNEPLRIIYDDQANKTTTRAANTRFRENYHLWRHYLNEMGEYFRYQPKLFCKAAVGIMRDGLLCKKTWGGVLEDVESPLFKFLVVLGSPVALYLSKKGK